MNVEDALSAARDGQMREAEDAIATAIADETTQLERWTPVAEVILKKEGAENRDALAWTFLDGLEKRLGVKKCIPHCSKVLRFFSKNDEFRSRAAELYTKAYETEGLDSLMDIAGVKGGKPLRRAMQTMNICLAIEPGAFLAHKDDGPPAQIVEIDSDTWNVRLKTPKGEDLVDAVSLGDQYELAAEHDFRVLSRFDPESFTKQLNSSPGDIVVTIIGAHNGQLTNDELESMLSPRHVKPADWSKWWTKTRAALRKNPHVRLEGRNPVTIVLEDFEISIEETLWPKFTAHDPPKQWLDLALEYVRECKNRAVDVKPEFLQQLCDAVGVEAAALEKRNEAPALAAWLVNEELMRMLGQEPDTTGASRVLNASDSLVELFEHLPSDTFVSLALAVLKNTHAETWPQDFAELMPVLPPGRSDDAVHTLVSAGHGELLKDLPQRILAQPVASLNGLCWLYQGPKDTSCFEPPPMVTLLSRILSVLDQSLALAADHARDLRARGRTTLSARRYARLKTCLEGVDAGMGDAISTQVRRCRGLSETITNEMMSAIRQQFPELWSKPKKHPWEDEEILYCTTPGKGSKEAELNELITVKMKENAKAIGDAAERGDLSENSEYKFALEERDLLRARVAEIQNQLSMAKVIDRNEVPSDHIGVGSSVRVRNTVDSSEATLTFLGPWEANIERNIFNYQAPISQAMMGMHIGESVGLDFGSVSGTYEIVAIEPGVN
jgi:transcription elongation factor GreA